jgi:hypothetical protein
VAEQRGCVNGCVPGRELPKVPQEFLFIAFLRRSTSALIRARLPCVSGFGQKNGSREKYLKRFDAPSSKLFSAPASGDRRLNMLGLLTALKMSAIIAFALQQIKAVRARG